MSDVKRQYRSPVRDAQAALTRTRIAEAAAVEFAERGWSGTTVAAIAGRAGVTPQAVHASVGGKAELLIRAVETAVSGSGEDVMLADRPAFAAVFRPGLSNRQRLKAFAAATASSYHRSGRLFLVLHDAARADPLAAQLAEQGGERRLAEHRRLARLLRPDGDKSSVATLTDALWALAGPAVYVDLVHRRKWTDEQYTAFIEATLDAVVRRGA